MFKYERQILNKLKDFTLSNKLLDSKDNSFEISAIG